MTIDYFDCKKCTNKYISAAGEEYCKPAVDGNKTFYFEELGRDEKGRYWDAVKCDYYTTEAKQLALYETARMRLTQI